MLELESMEHQRGDWEGEMFIPQHHEKKERKKGGERERRGREKGKGGRDKDQGRWNKMGWVGVGEGDGTEKGQLGRMATIPGRAHFCLAQSTLLMSSVRPYFQP